METIKIKMTKILKNINESLIALRNAIDSKGTPEMEKLKKQSVLLKKSLNLITKKIQELKSELLTNTSKITNST